MVIQMRILVRTPHTAPDNDGEDERKWMKQGQKMKIIIIILKIGNNFRCSVCVTISRSIFYCCCFVFHFNFFIQAKHACIRRTSPRHFVISVCYTVFIIIAGWDYISCFVHGDFSAMNFISFFLSSSSLLVVFHPYICVVLRVWLVRCR